MGKEKVKGLLCHNRNVSVGLMKDSPELLTKAAQYLESYKTASCDFVKSNRIRS